MNKYGDKNWTVWAVVLVCGTAACAAELTVGSQVLRGLEPSALARSRQARARVYRIDAQPASDMRLAAFAATAGMEESATSDNAHSRYSTKNDTMRAGAWYDAEVGRYLCFRDCPSELTVATDFPANLNSRAVSLLGELVVNGEEYMVSGMNAYVLQEMGGVPPVVYRRTYTFKRALDGNAVIAEEGRAVVQFDRLGRPTLVEVPAVALTPCAVAERLDPANLPERLHAFAAEIDTIVDGDRVMDIDRVAARSVVVTFAKETRGERRYLVPSQTVSLALYPREGEPVRRERHFSLDGSSRDHELADPWMKTR
jgi:hypothetical protein